MLSIHTQRELSEAVDRRTLHLIKLQAESERDCQAGWADAPTGRGWLCSAKPRPEAPHGLPGVHPCPSIPVGSPLLPQGSVCWKCQQDMDRYRRPETINHHNVVRDIFARTAQGAGLSPKVEAKKIMEDGQ